MKKSFRHFLQRVRNPAWRYLGSLLLVLMASAISIPLHFVIDAVNLVMVYLAAVVLAAAFLGRGPAILATVLSVLTFDFFLIEPRLSLSVQNAQYLLTFFGLLVVGLVISNTVSQLRVQYEIVRQREAHTAALNSLSRDLTGAVALNDMLHSVVVHIQQTFGRRVVVLLPGEQGLRRAADSDGGSEFSPDELERAKQAFNLLPGQSLSGGKAFDFLALRTSLGAVGVLGIENRSGRAAGDGDERSLMEGFANLAALAIERARLAEQASQAQVLQNTERLQAALLNSISHELRTPLVSITGSLSTLLESPPELQAAPQEARTELLETAYEEARRLNRLVGSLLDMSRLESGALRLSLEPCDLQDLVGTALERFGERQHQRMVRTRLEKDLPLLELDMPLMVQVLVNLLENSSKYSPALSPIELRGWREADWVHLEVSDRGPGIPPEDLERIFDKFYRVPGPRHMPGLGLGLSISKGIVEAHAGKIWAQNRAGGGLVITIALKHSGGINP